MDRHAPMVINPSKSLSICINTDMSYSLDSQYPLHIALDNSLHDPPLRSSDSSSYILINRFARSSSKVIGTTPGQWGLRLGCQSKVVEVDKHS